jgi:dipeptide transport system ATP-binding protein
MRADMATGTNTVVSSETSAPPNPFAEFWSYFSENRGAVGGLILIAAVVIVALFADLLAPHPYAEQYRTAFLRPPVWQDGGTWQFVLGTDDVGRDMLSRLMHGARISISVGAIVILLALTGGVAVGLTAGYAGGIVDIAIMRLMDTMLALPSLLLAIVVVAILGPSLFNAMFAVSIVLLPHFARLTRATVLSEMSKTYVVASRVSGAGALRLMFMTVLPNCLPPLRAAADAGVGHDAGGLDAVRAARLVGRDVSRTSHLGHGPSVQSSGRRATRCARSAAQTLMALLDIKNLSVEFPTRRGRVRAVEGVDLSIDEGEVVGIVGESGSGKSVSALAVMGLLAEPGRVEAERLSFDGRDLRALGAAERRAITGRDVAMIFQEPMTSLNPCFTVGFQIAEALAVHEGGSRRARRRRVIELLEQVGIPDARSRLNAYPHQLSGGMNQRVMIAMAIACNPRLLIADEPTTALDVTIQRQILDLLLDLQRQRGMALILITHNMGVVAQTAQRVVVMYAGQVMEEGKAADIFVRPRHPYTAALLDALPERAEGKKRLAAIPGVVPGLSDRPSGCLFNPRCRYASDRCLAERPPLGLGEGRAVRCVSPLT